MWQGIQAITDYKTINTTPQSNNASFPDELNSFYARFDRDNQEVAIKVVLPKDHQLLKLCPTDVCAALSRINACKAAGRDGIPGHVLACAGQLTEVLTDIFILSLAQASVPTCFKTTCIVPVPKHTKAASHNDFRPVLRGWSCLTSNPVCHPHWTPFNSPTARVEVRRMPSP